MPTEVRLPRWGMGMLEGTVLRWYKQEGDPVTAGEPLAEVEAAKLTQPIAAPTSGVLARVVVPAGATVPVNELLALITAPGEALPEAPAAPPTAARPVEPHRAAAAARGPEPRSVQATPLARRLAQEHGIDLGQVQGTGPGGRITDEDVRRAIAAGARAIPFLGRRRAIAQRLRDSLQTMAQVTLVMEADVTALVAWREELKRQFDLTYTDLVVKAVALALREHPRLNARLEGETIRLLPEVHVGVAVALEDGLLVPVVRDADRKSLQEIAQEARRLAERARAGTLTPAEASGSTFTVTNLGMYGVDAFTPIVNPPEAAILGIGRIVERPVRQDGGLAWRQVMTLSLTFDHRLVDGAPAAAFLQAVRARLEDPARLAS